MSDRLVPDTYQGALPAAYDRRKVARTTVLTTPAECRSEFATYLRQLAAKVASYEQRATQSVSQ